MVLNTTDADANVDTPNNQESGDANPESQADILLQREREARRAVVKERDEFKKRLRALEADFNEKDIKVAEAANDIEALKEAHSKQLNDYMTRLEEKESVLKSHLIKDKVISIASKLSHAPDQIYSLLKDNFDLENNMPKVKDSDLSLDDFVTSYIESNQHFAINKAAKGAGVIKGQDINVKTIKDFSPQTWSNLSQEDKDSLMSDKETRRKFLKNITLGK